MLGGGCKARKSKNKTKGKREKRKGKRKKEKGKRKRNRGSGRRDSMISKVKRISLLLLLMVLLLVFVLLLIMVLVLVLVLVLVHRVFSRSKATHHPFKVLFGGGAGLKAIGLLIHRGQAILPLERGKGKIGYWGS